MPAKKKPQEQSKKEDKKIKEKIIEDKTFGLKNKNKSASVQKYIKGVQQQVKGVMKGGERAEIAAQLQSKEDKKKSLADQLLLASLFKSVVEMPKGQDPKTIICSFYKSGLCMKGAKCKFSHDLSFEPIKEEKPDLYTDTRPVVTDIPCQFFVDAVESEKHGWFWKCPNGDECIYRHALPEGYVFRREEKKVESDDEDKPTLEETLDLERGKLPLGQKNITFEEFMQWINEDNLKREEELKERRGPMKGVSGRVLFEHNSGLFEDDEGAYDEYHREEQVDDFDAIDQRLVEEEGGKKMEDIQESKEEDTDEKKEGHEHIEYEEEKKEEEVEECQEHEREGELILEDNLYQEGLGIEISQHGDHAPEENKDQ